MSQTSMKNLNIKMQIAKLLPRAYNCLHLKNVAQSFRAASIGTVKTVRYRFNKDVLHHKNENYFMPVNIYPLL
jgi:hypothetical protein